jgi:hypothetical protein
MHYIKNRVFHFIFFIIKNSNLGHYCHIFKKCCLTFLISLSQINK